MADTWTVGGATSGYWATGSPNRATTPKMTRTIDNTAAKIGRSMKTWEIMGVCASVSLEEGSVMPPRVAQTGGGYVLVLVFPASALVSPAGRVGIGTRSGRTSIPGRTP